MNLKNLSNQCGNINISRNIFPNIIKSMISMPDLENIDLEHTVIDPNVCKSGGYIKLPNNMKIKNPFGKTVDKILIPNISPNGPISGHIVLSNLHIAVEQLVLAINTSHANIDLENYIINSANNIWGAMSEDLTGKTGLINNYVLGFRSKFSTKGHIATSEAIKHNQVGIPSHIYNKFVKEWETRCERFDSPVNHNEMYCIVFRNPLLHDDSMRKLHIIETKCNRIVINPVITAGMGADSDGDLIEVVLGYPDIDIKENWDSVVWDKEFLIDNQETKPNLDDIIQDGKQRIEKFRVIGPHDLIDPHKSDTIKEICSAEDLDLDDIKAFFSGKSKEEIRKDDIKVAQGLILQKAEIGKAGAAACRARVLANGDPNVSKAADIISEQANQRLFDSKHKLDDTYIKLIQVLRNDMKNNIEEAEKLLRECNIDPEEVKPYLLKLYTNDNPMSLREKVDMSNPTFHLVFDPNTRTMSYNEKVNNSISKVVKMCTNEDENDLITYLRKRTLNLGDKNDI